MPVAKDKVLPILENILKGKSASKTFKDELAAEYADMIDTEEGIEAFLNNQSRIIIKAVSEADRRATDATKKAKQDALDALNPPKDEPAQPTADPNQPAYVAELMKQMAEMRGEINGFRSQQSQQTIAQRYQSDVEKMQQELGVALPASTVARFTPTSDDGYGASLTELKELAAGMKQANFGNDRPAGAALPIGTDGKVKPASTEQVKDVMSQLS